MRSAAAKLSVSLFLLRVTVALVMTVWAVDKIVNPGHAGAVFSNFYGIEVSASGLAVIGGLQLAVIAAFVVGLFRTITYGAVLLMHAGSTLSSWRQYLEPFDQLLFFAAWPMLAGCVALFLLRKDDVLFSLHKRSQSPGRPQG
ncbi:MAG: hypothetical protein AB7P23_04640 [Amphiplicatus sp.]